MKNNLRKPKDTWTRTEQEKVILNGKAHLILSLGLSMQESE